MSDESLLHLWTFRKVFQTYMLPNSYHLLHIEKKIELNF